MAQDQPSFGYSDSFTPSRARKKRKSRPGNETASPSVLLGRTMEELTASDWLRDCQQILRDSLDSLRFSPQAVLCLGLGSPAVSRDARAQLAFLLAACDDLAIERSRVAVYDPVFTEEDIQLLDTLNIKRLTENRHASYKIESPTIIFMPHCDLLLYENLLRENWSKSGLPNLLLIANRLSEYAENVPSRKLSAEHPCVWRLAPYLTARALPICPAHPTAFNNTSVQYIRQEDFVNTGDGWWELPQRADSPGQQGGSSSGHDAAEGERSDTRNSGP